MKNEFKTPIIEIILINNDDVRTINSGDTFHDNELPFVPFSEEWDK